MKFTNPETGASLTGESNNPNFGTGGRYSGCLLDEFAKWDKSDEAAWTSLGDATPSRHAIGTPFGAGGTHYELTTNGVTKKLVIHWSLHPEKGENLACTWPKPKKVAASTRVDFLHWHGLTSPWYLKEKKRRKPKEIAQELDIDWIGSGAIVFDKEALARIMELRTIEWPILKLFSVDWMNHELIEIEKDSVDSLEGLVVLYREPTKHSLEVGGCDVAEGKEIGDYSVLKVMDRKTRSLTMSFYEQCSEVAIAVVIDACAKYIQARKKSSNQYPWWTVETIGPGLSTFDLLMEWGLSRLFLMPKFDNAKQEFTFTKGIRTNTNSRNKGITLVRQWLEDCEGWIDLRALKEMSTFVRNKNGKPEAKSGCHDDEVMAWLLTLLGDHYIPKAEFKEEEIPQTAWERVLKSQAEEPESVKELTPQEKALRTLERKQHLRVIEIR